MAEVAATHTKNADEHQTFAKDGPKDISKGPLKNRRCTDICCLILWILHMGGFWAVTFTGLQYGDPNKLYKPRDFSGGYCGTGSNFANYPKQLWTMNVSQTAGQAAMQLVCSSVANSYLASLLNGADYSDYLCACCLSPCSSCTSSLNLKDLTTESQMQATITSRLAELTNPNDATSLFSSQSSNLLAGSLGASAIWQQASSYFLPVCMPDSCVMPNTTSSSRIYAYSPSPDLPWQTAWQTLANNINSPLAIRSLINSTFKFTALSSQNCPYHAMYCVPFPGVSFQDMPDNTCQPQLSSSVSNFLGSSVTQALNSNAVSSMRSLTSSSVGDFANAILQTVDVFFIVSFWGFVVGLVFMVALRWLVGVVTWAALVLIVLLLLGGGALSYIRSTQCAGSSFLQTGQNVAVAAWSLAEVSAYSGTLSLETISGNGANYRGVQTLSQSGKACQAWGSSTPYNISATWTAQKYPFAGLVRNYCRNPNNFTTIWCVTTDSSIQWELCSPIGVLTPTCAQGYMVTSTTMRQALQVCAYIIWSLAGLWLLLIGCLVSRIRLAIAINKVAAMFVYHTPFILFVPVIQIVVGICWLMVWMVCASFMISEVPDGYVPTGNFASYSAAYGNATTAGACTDMWPSGYGWKDEVGCSTSGINSTVFLCWRCYPPRYVLNGRIAYSVFTLLWNNALMVAVGQCIVAGAAAAWFFTPRANKGSTAVLRTAVWNTFRYHFGSLAFGACILAGVQFLRLTLMYFQKQAEAHKNKVMVLILQCLGCLLYCLEKCIKFLNKNAYIQIAIMGTNFCTSAKNAFFLILRNILRFSTVAMLGTMIYAIGSSFIVVTTTASGYLILQALRPDVSPVAPVISYVVVSILIAMLYMNIYAMAVDTSLQCFAAAEEMQDTAEFVPKALASLIARNSSDKPAISAARGAQVAPTVE